MTKLLIASLLALGISTSAPIIDAPSVGEVNECTELVPAADPEPMSCKASGHDCVDREDCCSRMCDKKKKKCA